MLILDDFSCPFLPTPEMAVSEFGCVPEFSLKMKSVLDVLSGHVGLSLGSPYFKKVLMRSAQRHWRSFRSLDMQEIHTGGNR